MPRCHCCRVRRCHSWRKLCSNILSRMTLAHRSETDPASGWESVRKLDAASRRLGPVARMHRFDIRWAHKNRSPKQDVVKITGYPSKYARSAGLSHRRTTATGTITTIPGSARRAADVMRNFLCSMGATCQPPALPVVVFPLGEYCPVVRCSLVVHVAHRMSQRECFPVCGVT